jgi:hypothetical protein
MIRYGYLVVLLLFAAIPATAYDYTVPPAADLFLAGQPEDAVLTWSGTGSDSVRDNPAFETGRPLTPGQAVTFTADGKVYYDACPPALPDGVVGQLVSLDPKTGKRWGVNFVNETFSAHPLGMGGYSSIPRFALIGVFTSDNIPQLESDSSLPESLDFDPIQTGRDFRSLSPKLLQVFFIGDGKTGKGLRQHFVVPKDATRLFLATNDCPGAFFDNTGSFTVSIAEAEKVTKGSASISGTFKTYDRQALAVPGSLADWQKLNLTKKALDWRQWGGVSTKTESLPYKPDMTVRKLDGDMISPLTITPDETNNSPAQSASDSLFLAGWTDGNPERAKTLIRRFVQSQSMSFSVWADTQPRTLRIWAPASQADGRLSAKVVSEQGETLAAYEDTVPRPNSEDDQEPKGYCVAWTIRFNGTSAYDRLTVTWEAVNGAVDGSVGLQAAKLSTD